MHTNLPDVFASGDRVETRTTACSGTRHTFRSERLRHKQGRVAGENAVGRDRAYAGALGTQSLKAFDLAIACTGRARRRL
jgi:NADPH-dependent 2,4-dienoyl-CoA reductase/sulfur reductase-like enzyme